MKIIDIGKHLKITISFNDRNSDFLDGKIIVLTKREYQDFLKWIQVISASEASESGQEQ